MLLALTATSFGQLSGKALKKMGPSPILFIDSVEVDFHSFQALNPFEISNVTIVRPKTAKKLIGDKGVDGAVYVTTVSAAKQAYWAFFGSKSQKYKQLIPSPQADTSVQYILNGESLTDSAAPGALWLAAGDNFKSLDMIDKEDGRFTMHITYPKRYVAVITAKRPKGLLRKKSRLKNEGTMQ
ncbi:MAG: hypothetical protein ABW019_03400 [Chitinophagaceae bacterium]